ncbi:unnamed protein product [Strongylus vulgaris]|uniref:Uncharacterized protein n=1 Tax=Strongylus vulgaris TaxID=40348 RepID=A0A3P7K0I5_STRVU|nr:unnamed protein product [Strongylus vulgaris]
MSISPLGFLTLSVYDGFFFNHKNTEKRWNLSDNILHDIAFCASETNYTGCVSRLQVGSSFPLKNPKAARLKHSGRIRFGSCSMDIIDTRQPITRSPDDEGIHIYAIAHAKNHIISVTCKLTSE